MNRPRLFVSAVSKELGSARRLVADTLRRLGFDTVTQDDFPTGPGELRAWLEQQIAGCEGVFQLVGLAYGREPPMSDAPERPWPDPAFGPCSYTQFELLYAQRLRKHTWVIEVGPGCRRDREPAQLDLPPTRDGEPAHPDPVGYQAERRALQLAYVERLRAINHLRHPAASDDQIKLLVHGLRDELAELRERYERVQQQLIDGQQQILSQGRETRAAIDELAGQRQITTERIRAHLLTAVEDAYRRDLQAAETVADWQARERQRQAAAAQRAAQVARIEDLAASFAAIEARGEASSVFTELTRILKEQGVDPALAYVAAKRVGILDQVRNRQAAARQRNRDDLQPLLTSAGLYAAKGEAGSARALYQEVLELEPEWPAALDGNRWFLIEQGDLAVVRGHLPDAGRDFAQAKAMAERLTGLEPDDRDWQRNMGLCLNRIGNSKAAQGDLAGALADYGQSRAIAERLAASDPSNADWQHDLSVSLERLGDTKAAQGDLVGALADYGQSHAIRERLAAADPSNAGWQHDLSVSLDRLGDTKAARGDLAGARADCGRSRATAERLAAADPSNAGWQRDLSVSLNKLGDTKAAQGDLAGALAAYGQSRAIRERLAASDPSNARWQRDLAVSHYNLGKIAGRQGREDLLRQHWGEVLAIFAAMQQRGLHVSPADLAELETIRAQVQGAAR